MYSRKFNFWDVIVQLGAFFVFILYETWYTPMKELEEVGLCETGTVFEQQLEIVRGTIFFGVGS